MTTQIYIPLFLIIILGVYLIVKKVKKINDSSDLKSNSTGGELPIDDPDEDA